jgi:uncharacterized delta-60 repeat protein
MTPKAITSLLGALALTGAIAAAAAPAANAGPFDDLTFDGDGRLLLQEPAYGRAVAVQPDGRIVVAGSDLADNVAVWRLHPDGSLDRSFSGDGRAVIDAGGADFGAAVAIARDGKIVVAGSTRTGISVDDFAVVRLEVDGDLDPTFNPAGARPGVRILAGDAYNRAEDVVVQEDGGIVVAGRGRNDYAIARLDAVGAPDGTVFELDGTGGMEAIDALALAGGRIVAAGDGVMRFLASGALDDSFAGDGVAAAPAGTNDVTDVLAQPDGSLVIAGTDGGVDTRMFLARLSTEGEVDTAFGAGGLAAPEFTGAELASTVVRQADGKLLVVGSALDNGVNMVVARFNSEGDLDTGYGTGGRLVLPFEAPSVANDAVLQADGRLVLAGAAGAAGQDPRPAVARVLAAPPAQEPGGPGPGPGPGDGPGSGGDPGDGGETLSPGPTCGGKPATIVGTAGAETLHGTPGDDVIVARGGADRVQSGRGHDLVCGGSGRDVLRGGRGADRLLGGSDRDRCLGGAGRDRGKSCERRQSLRV